MKNNENFSDINRKKQTKFKAKNSIRKNNINSFDLI